MDEALQMKLSRISELRKQEYLKYLSIKYKVRNNRRLTTDEAEEIVNKAYSDYKEIEKYTEKIEMLIEQEELEREIPIPVQYC
ncbi:hypothetical protein NSA24_03135 [Clostridioides mangenotii]|uniref:hypothetical protein n=1 Tax=Metaclostridioides mangenotii TaxID=1540 RepID=UPI001C0FFA67|nr:hypothetical protein [Clostridioides mangenotii]MBU5308426.1 hypothetical protein [Clostridioides mangenotii]MCR1953828.1 hypothetical protein [Clostridioides mangenotii]